MITTKHIAQAGKMVSPLILPHHKHMLLATGVIAETSDV